MVRYRHETRIKHMKIAFIAAAVTAALFLCACADGNEQITSLDQLNEKGRVIAAATDAPEANTIERDFPKATLESCADIFPAFQEVSGGRIDAVMSQRIQMELAIENGLAGTCILEETYCENPVVVGISRKTKIPDLQDRINEFLKEKRDDGTLDDMYRRWVTERDDTMPDIPEAEDPQYTLVVATTGAIQPWTYYEGDRLTGHDIELARRFAAWLNADLKFKVYDWGGLLSAAQMGEVDCIISDLYYHPETEDVMDYSDPYLMMEITAMVKDQGSEQESGPFLRQGKDNFERTFMTESRWKLFVKGMWVTFLITALSVLLGTQLGFAVYMACRRGGRLANGVTRFTVWLVQGMPVVVLLMLLYYVVLGPVSIPGTIVSILGFTLIFGATVYERIKTGVSAVDSGQTEAAYSLGYSDRRAFYRIVLPQAMPFMIPSFKGDMTGLLKATAVVGYIAVQDLTKMADIVRSRTYDAFFPLISIAVIYFVLEALLSFIVDRMEPLLDPRKRRRRHMLKGVEQK